MDQGCLFCRIVAGEIPARIVFQDEQVLAFEDITPQAPVHLLIVPKRHLPHLFATATEEAPLLGRMITTASALARQAGLEEKGFRLVMNCLADAGQSVFHLHLHLLGGRRMGWPPG